MIQKLIIKKNFSNNKLFYNKKLLYYDVIDITLVLNY